ncbi:thiamine pyrophosphate-dependent dehydrogenase E1 component subunit alpha [Paenibacillus spongiae]|uniref:Thiamine pyrophosphate-dependent dehydrogenase E1 component subunit alpha n=1 Tax=Paenibacillus spongiae TaxID=2909671 RepID=A0ABY5SKC9_9BACL|nr:thiamine pyrophosphate-dependent dehydrogenase E1 component subunit alpha [Paenibacillus spongiae]UVI32970.1 thiamine pyrophosphate-dependent dehydrogenase E1 component subunit alpha [Paenibacillus spongiae]
MSISSQDARQEGRYSFDSFDSQLLKRFLKEMLRIRVFEQRAEELTLSGKVVGGVHLAIGQEAVAVGVMMALKEEDYVTGPHRGHHILIAKGLETSKLMAELLGKETGIVGGRGGSMHMADASKGMLGVNGIVGASIVIATGAAFTAQYLIRDQAAVAFFGDGGANKGQFHESLNMASIFKLPAIYVCENNQYAVETSVEYSTAAEHIADRGAGYRMPGVIVDGLDVLDVYSAAKEARLRAGSGEGPTLIEAKTYRFKGHSIGDLENYRTREEVQEWMKNDPIIRLKLSMEELGLLDENGWNAMKTEVEQEIEAAVQFAVNSPEPNVETVMDHNFSAEVTEHA